MKIRFFLLGAVLALSALSGLAAGKATSTRSMAEALMRERVPRLTFDTATVTREQFMQWRDSMKVAMARLMKHPDYVPQPPQKIATAQRDGFRVEKWESYPLPGAVVPFLLLVPDGVDAANPAPGVLCIPGFGQTKELLAGERQGNFTLEGEPDSLLRKAAMAVHMAKQGYVALAVDNPSCGELSDNGVADYVTSSRFLLELGWSWLGLASWQDRVALNWLKELPEVRRDRIIVSGFSLGTEPLMVLGLMDDEIFAFVYNDFLCRTRERALVMNKPDERGVRGYPNNIEHLIPEFLVEFDFPDIVGALAPRPVICTEGGMDRDFDRIRRAYRAAEAEDAFEYHHYAKYVDPADRIYLEELPDGLDRTEFFRLVNCDSPNHYFKLEHIMPWLTTLCK